MSRNLLVLLAALVLAACDGNGSSSCTSDCVNVNTAGPLINGSGIIKTEVRAVDKFMAIRFSGVGHLVIERTGAESLTVTADDNLLPLFTSEVKDGTLYLSIAKGNSFSGKSPVFRVTIGDLRELDVTGSGSVDATKLDGVALSLSISGSGSAKVAGRIDALTVSISGSGSADAGELKAKRAKVVVSGSGDLTVNASDELDAEVAGSGEIWYIGSPKLTSSVFGSGSIKKKAN